MEKSTYDSMIKQAIDDAVDRLLPNGGGATVTESRLRQTAAVLAQQVATATRAYELLGIRTSDELAADWSVSRRRAQAFIATLHTRWGVGRKIGNVWCLSAEEAATHRPAPRAGRPAK